MRGFDAAHPLLFTPWEAKTYHTEEKHFTEGFFHEENCILLLALCMCLSAFVLLTACGHEHTYKTEWSKDATNHWHDCEGEDCTEVADKAEHTWNAGEITTAATKEAAGVKTFTCTACAQTKTESVAYVVKTTVTAAEWAAAFDLGENWTFTATATHPVYEQVMSEMQKRDGNKFCSIETFADLSGTVLGAEESYDEIAGDVWYRYNYHEDTETYEKIAVEESVAERLAEMIEAFIPQDLRDFADYEYDEEKKAYVADSIFYEEEEMDVMDLVVKFEDGKIVAFDYKVVVGGASVPYTVTLTYGDAAVTLPTVG